MLSGLIDCVNLMRRGFSSAFGLALLWMAVAAPAAQAQQLRSVLELFTSQGCSSCPPADKLLGELARRSDVIALTFPVDIWDYIGWKDTLATPAFSARQKGYAATRGDGHVYTPQMVVNGVTHVVGSDAKAIDQTIEAVQGRNGALKLPLSVTQAGAKILIDVGADVGRSASVYVLGVAQKREVTIGRGENKDRMVTYTNVVRSVTPVGAWNGSALHLEVERGPEDGFVVLVQQGDEAKPALILAAAKSPNL